MKADTHPKIQIEALRSRARDKNWKMELDVEVVEKREAQDREQLRKNSNPS